MSTLVLGKTPRQQPQAVRELWFAGVGGGVGTTTMVALTAAYLNDVNVGCTVADHWGGDVAGRLATAGGRLAAGAPPLPETTFGPAQGAVRLTLVDAGRAGPRLADVFQRSDVAVALVAPPTPEGASELVELRDGLLGHTAPGRVQALVCDVLGCSRDTLRSASTACAAAAVVGYLPALAQPGPLALNRVRGGTAGVALRGLAALLHGVLVA